MDDYISREAAEQFICDVCERPGCPILLGGDCDRIDRLNKIPAAYGHSLDAAPGTAKGESKQ
jgi:hypothetical protein